MKHNLLSNRIVNDYKIQEFEEEYSSTKSNQLKGNHVIIKDIIVEGLDQMSSSNLDYESVRSSLDERHDQPSKKNSFHSFSQELNKSEFSVKKKSKHSHSKSLSLVENDEDE